MLRIIQPSGYAEERNYILRVIFEEFMGLSYECHEGSGNTVQIRLAHAPEEGALMWSDVLFQTRPENWLTEASLPKSPLPIWNAKQDLPDARLVRESIPIIYGRLVEGGRWFTQKEKVIQLGLDVAGSVFFMLTRYEEAVLSFRDKHGRFPAEASLAYREGFLERPIVDEYLEILWACMKRLWPDLKRKEWSYQVYLSHDIDHPLGAVNKSWFQVLKNIGGDVIRRKDVDLAFRRFKAKLIRNYSVDPFNTFSFIMDLSEQYGLKSSFYFKTGFSNEQFDESYSLNSPWMEKLLRNIYERGHEIGLHTSYDAYNDLIRTRSEFEALLRVTDKLNIVQRQWGGRQHYLRWENPVTWQIWEDAGLDYDSTLGFADHVGFRCGTCREFTVFNLNTREPLRLRERPLIAMDTTLLAPQYMALRPEQAIEWIERLSSTCRRFEGTFSLLWHNTNLVQAWQGRLYLKILEAIQ
jgi:hypothetical protein